ncbi:MAG: hypothetical protein IT382_25235, partial [Deltaproteobacteria bacterium]|nr:hypothetical protein [Deltaproteobacteria bacterium]
VFNDGVVYHPFPGARQLHSGGPELSIYELRCSAPGGDPAPTTAGGFRVLWREATAGDLALLGTLHFAMRSITISGVALTSVDLGSLRQVWGAIRLSNLTAPGGTFSFSAPHLTDVRDGLAFGVPGTPARLTGLTDVSIPVLRSIGGLHLATPALTSFTAPLLERTNQVADGYISILYGDALQSVSFPVLVSAGSLAVQEAPVLESVEAPQLTALGRSLALKDVPQLADLSLPLLGSVGSVGLIFENTGLSAVSLPSLQSIGGYLHVLENAELQTLSLPALTAVGAATGAHAFRIEGNLVLTTFDLDALRTTDAAGAFVIQGNRTLPCDEIAPLYCQLDSRNPDPTITDNVVRYCLGTIGPDC